jgi:hypothetical protein
MHGYSFIYFVCMYYLFILFAIYCQHIIVTFAKFIVVSIMSCVHMPMPTMIIVTTHTTHNIKIPKMVHHIQIAPYLTGNHVLGWY